MGRPTAQEIFQTYAHGLNKATKVIITSHQWRILCCNECCGKQRLRLRDADYG